jgi:site-specific recombinase XerD
MHLAPFLDHLRLERRLADHTVTSYARDLEALARFAAGRGVAIEALERADLEAFVRQ